MDTSELVHYNWLNHFNVLFKPYSLLNLTIKSFFFRYCNTNSNHRATSLRSSKQHHLQQQPHLFVVTRGLWGLQGVWVFDGFLYTPYNYDDHLLADNPSTTQEG